MAVINTQYSTLEEAWGTEKKPIKQKQRECDLYDKGKKGILRRPHRQNTEKELKYKNMMLLGDDTMENEDYERYHGYSDSRKYSRTTKPLKKHKERFSSKKPKSKKRVVVDPNLNTYYDPDELMQMQTSRALRPRQVNDNEGEYIYEEMYDEDEDNYLTQGVTEVKKLTHDDDFIDEEDDEFIDEEQLSDGEITEESIEEESESYRQPRRKKNISSTITKTNGVDHRQLLDLTIYTMSGIILIFLMEQFVQIGVKIKTLK
tara:strand:- start:397 stop:1176 length:780 start_codon:yes stop_codon:yes gene_type:complete